MPEILCSNAPDCDYVTDSEASISETITLLQTHERTKHEQQVATSNSLKADKVRRPTITGGASSEHWQYFVTRWEEYAAATKLADKDTVLQLLECCDDQLRRDLTLTVEGTLSKKQRKK